MPPNTRSATQWRSIVRLERSPEIFFSTRGLDRPPSLFVQPLVDAPCDHLRLKGEGENSRRRSTI